MQQVAYHWVHLDHRNFTLAPRSRDDQWMLRNLDKRQFVIKSDRCSSHGLPQALFSLIGWSEDDDIAMRCDDHIAYTITHGRWAGDRIDVTLSSLHDKEQGDDDSDWEDITDEVVEFLESLAKSDREEDWVFDDW